MGPISICSAGLRLTASPPTLGPGPWPRLSYIPAAKRTQRLVCSAICPRARVLGGTQGGTAGNKPCGCFRVPTILISQAISFPAPLWGRLTSSPAPGYIPCSSSRGQPLGNCRNSNGSHGHVLTVYCVIGSVLSVPRAFLVNPHSKH